MKKIFHMYSDIGVMSYFNDLKLTEAKKMLLQGMPVGVVSSMLAFSSQNYFTVFKSKTGMSPKHYAAAAKNNCNTKATFRHKIGMWLFIMLLFYLMIFIKGTGNI